MQSYTLLLILMLYNIKIFASLTIFNVFHLSKSHYCRE